MLSWALYSKLDPRWNCSGSYPSELFVQDRFLAKQLEALAKMEPSDLRVTVSFVP